MEERPYAGVTSEGSLSRALTGIFLAAQHAGSSPAGKRIPVTDLRCAVIGRNPGNPFRDWRNHFSPVESNA